MLTLSLERRLTLNLISFEQNKLGAHLVRE